MVAAVVSDQDPLKIETPAEVTATMREPLTPRLLTGAVEAIPDPAPVNAPPL
jgi:hypothetical protein